MHWLERIVDGAAAFAALAAVIFLFFRSRRRRVAVPASAAAPAVPPDDWNAEKEESELRRRVDETPELRSLYAKLGSLPEVEREAGRIAAELKGLIRAEVPDFAAFDAALTEAAAQLAGPSGDGGEEPGGPAADRPRFRAENEALLRAVLAVRQDHDAVLRLLNEDPVDQLLPVIEQIPMVRNGEVIWRTPMELSLVRKRPSRPDRFERLLDELDWLVRSARLRRRPAAREAVLAAIVRLRRDAARENAYLPTAMQALAAEIDVWLHRSLDPVTRRRREELDELLRGLLRVRHGLSRAAGDLREAATAHAQLYAGQPWMATPWLTTTVLANLLDTELAALPEAERARPNSPTQILRLVRDEVASRHYDSDETIRRLRQQEERGLFVHSLVYALLRMNRLPSAVPEEPGIPRGDSGEQNLP
jgi:hypothetical protein